MPKLIYLIFPVFIFDFFGTIQAQLSKDAVPLSYKYNLPAIEKYIQMESFDSESMIKLDESNEKQGLKVIRFAKMLNVNLSPENSGSWDATKEGRVWRLGIISRNAYSLYPVFGSFKLSDKVSLFAYTPRYRELKGAFTKKNNNIHNVMAVSPLPSDTLILELNVPEVLSDYGTLVLTKVGHDYRNAFGKHQIKDDTNPTPEGTCYVDINCPDGADWQSEKKGVCKILIGDNLCSGSLIANSNEDKTPYFLTANHCLSDSSDVPGSIFYFNYEKTFCDSSIINPAQTLSGASIIATTDFTLDFMLLKLNDLPPVSYHPFFNGWDWSGVQPQSGTCIHHPKGAVKKISMDYNPLIQGSYNFDLGYDTRSFWEITQYNVGATEPGSSGCPLFDSQHHVVGTLTGGPASCTNPSGGDYYTMFALDWDTYSNPENQLKAWLDPNNSGVSMTDGYDPYGFDISNCDTTWNSIPNELPYARTSTFPWLNDYQSNTITDIAEKFFTPAWLDIFGAFFNVNTTYGSQELSMVTFKVWSGDVLPAEEIYSQEVFIKNIRPKAINFVAFDSVVKVSGNFFIGYSVTGIDSFTVYHVQNRGYNGPSTVYVNNGTWQPIDAITSPALYTSLAIGLTECNGKIQIPDPQQIKIYPNPCTNYINVQTAEGVNLTGIKCFDITGHSLPISYDLSIGNAMVRFNLPSGMYFLKVLTASSSVILRFIVVIE